MSITKRGVRQWRIIAAADRAEAEPFYPCRVSRLEQSLRPNHTAVAWRMRGGSPGGPGVGDLFAA